MAEHQHGSMDTKVQEETFNGFISWTVKVCVLSISILVFMALVNITNTYGLCSSLQTPK